MDSREPAPAHPSLRVALLVWAKIGLLSFGGPTGQIALMHRELVERRRWVSDGRFLHALNYCMVLPGPEAQQLAIYLGWLLHRTWGGVLAGLFFVLPGAVLMAGISVAYVLFGRVPLVEAVFYGLKPAVMAIVAAAVIRIGRKALRNAAMVTLTAVAFAAIFFFAVPFPVILLVAATIGLVGGRWRPDWFDQTRGPGEPESAAASAYLLGDAREEALPRPKVGRTVGTILAWTVAWMLPLVACVAVFGFHHPLTQEGLFFSKAALVTVGGAYAVLPYVAQQAVETHGWLTAAQMMDGLALAETTPGPLILVLQFVGFLGAWNAPGAMPPLVAGLLGAFISSWVTFVPGFLFILAGAPYVERSRGNRRVNAALSAVTAAVVGVVLNLSIWFAWHVIRPEGGGTDWFPVGAALGFFYLLQRRRLDVLPVIGLGALLGVAWRFLT